MEPGNDDNNRVYIYGEVETEPEYSHEVRDETFYTFMVRVFRLSGKADDISVTISDKLLTKPVEIGDTVSIIGQLRSYSKEEWPRPRHVLTVFARELLDARKGENPNSIILVGYLCKSPVYRMTGNNREISDLLIAVNRSFGKSDYIPAIAWGKNARFVRALETGDRVAVAGRIQSKKQLVESFPERVTSTVYEISVSQIMAYDESSDFDAEAEYDLFAAPKDESDRY